MSRRARFHQPGNRRGVGVVHVQPGAGMYEAQRNRRAHVSKANKADISESAHALCLRDFLCSRWRSGTACGSAMYSLQSLWTQAREQLPVTTIILNNSKYNILIGEYKNVGATPGDTAMSMLDIANPGLNWVNLANGMGVEAARATTLEECADLMEASFGKQAPFLIELMV